MKVTCGVLFRINGTNKFLVNHATMSKVWSIPKGIMDPTDKSEEDAACREVKEETGLTINPEKLSRIGTYPYTDEKNITIFSYLLDEKDAPDPSNLVCTSCFERTYNTKGGIKKTVKIPECDKFKYIDIKEVEDYCNKRMAEILQQEVDWH